MNKTWTLLLTDRDAKTKEVVRTFTEEPSATQLIEEIELRSAIVIGYCTEQLTLLEETIDLRGNFILFSDMYTLRESA